MTSPLIGIRNWLDERFDLEGIKALVQKKKVPVHRYSYWYFLGGMTLFLFGVQVIDRSAAADVLPSGRGRSLRKRAIHRDAGAIRVAYTLRALVVGESDDLTAFVHMFSVVFLKAYRRPRELTWISWPLVAVPDVRVRFQRVPLALEHALLFRD